jgi:hypothetical protein
LLVRGGREELEVRDFTVGVDEAVSRDHLQGVGEHMRPVRVQPPRML